MANDLEVYSDGGGGGGVQPYAPSPLSPLSPSPDTWGRTDIDVLTPRELDQGQRGGQVRLFGEAMPPGTTPQQLQQVLGEIGGVYLSDFSKLGHPHSLIQSAIQFFMTNATKPPQQVTRHHSFNLYNQAGDWLAESFGNYLHSLNGTQAQKQKFLSDSLWWLGELNKKLGTSKPSAHGSATPTPAGDPLDSLNDAQYAQVVAANDAARAATMDYLRSIWHDSFDANLRMVDAYFTSLPLREQKALDQMTTGYISSLNTREVILHLYQQALQESGGPLPSGGALAAEIAEHERAMKVDRRAWLKNEVRQSRYRHLLTLRDRS